MKESISEFVLKKIKELSSNMAQLTESRATALQLYNANTLPEDSIDTSTEDRNLNRSSVVVPIVRDVVNWTVPVITEIFCGDEDVVKISPFGRGTPESAEKLELLLRYQTRVKNKWFVICHDLAQESLLMKCSVIKYQWHTETERIIKQYYDIDEMQRAKILMQPNVEIVKEQKRILDTTSLNPQQLLTGEPLPPPPVKYDLEVAHVFTVKYPLLEVVPVNHVGFDPTARDVESMDFIFHKYKMPKWEIIRKYGKDTLEKIEKVEDDLTNDKNRDMVTIERFADVGGLSFLKEDKEDNSYWIYECFFNHPDTGEPRVVKLCGDIVLYNQRNIYGQPPFVIVTTHKLAHRVCGLSMPDLLSNMQVLITKLVRNILDHVYFTNNGRYVADPLKINLEDLENNNVPGGVIRGDPGAISSLPISVMQPWIFSLVEYANKMVEYGGGVPRAFQGVDVARLNKTFRGQSQQINQAFQRIRLMARLIAETGIQPLYRALVKLNLQFLDEPQTIRILGDTITINPDNILGQYDVLVNVSVGTSHKETTIIQMQQLLSLYAQFRKAGLSIVTEEDAYYATSQLIKAMGYQNVENFLSQPEFTNAIKEMIMFIGQLKMRLMQNPQLAQSLLSPQEMQHVDQFMVKIINGAGLSGDQKVDAGTMREMRPPVQSYQPGQSIHKIEANKMGDNNYA